MTIKLKEEKSRLYMLHGALGFNRLQNVCVGSTGERSNPTTGQNRFNLTRRLSAIKIRYGSFYDFSFVFIFYMLLALHFNNNTLFTIQHLN